LRSFGDGHLVGGPGAGAAGEVVEERGGFGHDDVVVEGELLGAGVPGGVGGLVLEHEEEGAVGVALVAEPVDGEVGEDLGDVAGAFDARAIADHGGVVVLALVDEDVVVVEAAGFGAEVPLADEGGLVAGLLEQYWKGGEAAIEESFVGGVADHVGVQAGEDGRAAGGTDGVGGEVAIEAEAFVGEAVDVWCGIAIGAVGADGLGAVIIGEDEDDVGAIGGGGGDGR
jgi:hypothetical protein